MTLKQLEDRYDINKQAGDSTENFYKWAINYLLDLVTMYQKEDKC